MAAPEQVQRSDEKQGTLAAPEQAPLLAEGSSTNIVRIENDDDEDLK